MVLMFVIGFCLFIWIILYLRGVVYLMVVVIIGGCVKKIKYVRGF